MDVIEVIKKRRCVRKFDSSKKITDKQIQTLLKAASLAPSAGNLQSWYFVVVKNEKIKQKLVKAAMMQTFIKNAPVVIVSCANTKRASTLYGKRGSDLYAIQDATIATQNIFLQATSMKLGACWVGAFNEDKVKEILSLKKHLLPVAILPTGYPKKSPKTPRRRKLEKISKTI